MIDTDKYEGHNKAPWRTAEGQPYDDEGSHLDIVDANGVLVTETSPRHNLGLSRFLEQL